ncbi:MAG: hypothetical protein WAN23_08550 [Candidatus Acidiferrales bacterium]
MTVQRLPEMGDVTAVALMEAQYRHLPDMQIFDPKAFPEGIHDRIKHVLRHRREGWTEFVARTGLSAGQIMLMTPEELVVAVEAASVRTRDDLAGVFGLAAATRTRGPVPKRFSIEGIFNLPWGQK